MIGKHINLIYRGELRSGRIRTIEIYPFAAFTSYAFYVVFGANDVHMYQYNIEVE